MVCEAWQYNPAQPGPTRATSGGGLAVDAAGGAVGSSAARRRTPQQGVGSAAHILYSLPPTSSSLIISEWPSLRSLELHELSISLDMSSSVRGMRHHVGECSLYPCRSGYAFSLIGATVSSHSISELVLHPELASNSTLGLGLGLGLGAGDHLGSRGPSRCVSLGRRPERLLRCAHTEDPHSIDLGRALGSGRVCEDAQVETHVLRGVLTALELWCEEARLGVKGG